LKIGSMANASLFFIIILMFIGASPGSTGGGIKTATLAILVATFFSMIRNKNEVCIFGRTIPRTVVRRAIVIFLLSSAWIVVTTFILSIIESDIIGAGNFLNILFETTSAFSTVGLSTGITSSLSVAGRLLICLTIFIGRLGPLTVALAIALKLEDSSYVSYPEERVMVG